MHGYENKKFKNENSDVNSDTIILNLEVDETEENDPYKNKGVLKTKDDLEKVITDKDITMYDSKKEIQFPPPYVIWVQFFGMNQGQEEELAGEPMNPDTRNQFVRKVFAIVLLCLIITAVVAAVCWIVEPINEFFQFLNPMFLLVPMVIMIGVNLAIGCTTCAQYPPWNYVCLVISVLCMTFTVTFATSKTRAIIILYAVIATVVVVIVCLLLACSSFDFTKWMLYVIVIGAALAALSMIYFVATLVFKIYFKPLHIGILVVLTLFNVVTLTIELQMILGGRQYSIAEDQYIFGATILYLSIIHMFLKLLSLIRIFSS